MASPLDKLPDLFGRGRDAYQAGAAFTLNKAFNEVTQEERNRFRVAFLAAFQFRGPELIASVFEFQGAIMDELDRRGIWDDVTVAIHERHKE